MEDNKVIGMPTPEMMNGGEAKPPLNTTKRELSPEAKAYITDTCKTIILDSIPREDLEKYLYNVTLNVNEQTKDFDAAVLSIFYTPKSMNDLVCVNVVTLDLITQKVSAPPIFFGPIVIRKDKNGIERDAVIIGRYGDISITNSSPAISIAPLAEIDAYYAQKAAEAVDITDKVEGEIVE